MCCSWLLSALGGWYLRFQGFWGYWHAKANGTGKPIRLCCTCVINAWDFSAFSTCFKRSTLLSKQSLSFSIYLYHLLHRKLTIPWKSMVKEDDSFLFDILNPFFRGGDIHFIIFFGWGGWYSSGFINIYIYINFGESQVAGRVNAYSYSSAIISSETWQRSLSLWNELRTRDLVSPNVVAMNACLRLSLRKDTGPCERRGDWRFKLGLLEMLLLSCLINFDLKGGDVMPQQDDISFFLKSVDFFKWICCRWATFSFIRTDPKENWLKDVPARGNNLQGDLLVPAV